MDGFVVIGSGSHLSEAFQKVHPDGNLLLLRKDCDITNKDSIRKSLENSDYKYVLNCAAITDLAWCEAHSDECFSVNAIGAKNIEDVCLSLNKKLIQISSDYAINPLNVYGKTKNEMEEILDKSKTLILRTSFYHDKYEPFNSLLNRKKTYGFTNLFFNPVSSYFLAQQIIENKDAFGLINIFSNKKISKFDFLQNFCGVFNIDQNILIPGECSEIESGLRRPTDSYVRPDIGIDIKEDLELFKKYFDPEEAS